VTYSDDAAGRLKTVVRGGATTNITYDPGGRKTFLDDPDLGDWYHTYDALAQLFRQKDARGQVISRFYDALGRQTAKLAPDSLTTSLYDPFNTQDLTNWTWSAHQTVPYADGGNNVVKNTGTGIDYNANFYRSAYSLAHGEALQVRFKVSSTDTIAHFSIEANGSPYQRFGAIANSGKLYVQYVLDGVNYVYPGDLIASLATNTWYVVEIVVDDAGGFSIQAYKESDPTQRGVYRQAMGAGRSWRFHHWIYRNSAYLDDYREAAATLYSYDQGANGIGRRTGMLDSSGSTEEFRRAMGG
jgi:YD repeat-containing protein